MVSAAGTQINSVNSWAQALLAQIGAPQTPNNIKTVSQWWTSEGGAGPQFGVKNNIADYNPLNVTLTTGPKGYGYDPGTHAYYPGAQPTPGNNPPVAAFSDWSSGLDATAARLQQPFASKILADLKANAPASQVGADVAASGCGSGNFAGDSSTGATATTGGATPANLTAATSTSVLGIPSTPPPTPDQSANPITDIGRDVKWFGQFAAWTIFTALIFLFGMILLLLGMVMLGVVLLGPVVGPAGQLIPGPVGRLARSGKGSSVGAPGRTVAAVRGPRARTTSGGGSSDRLFQQRRSLQDQRHEHRMTEIEHRASARRSNMGRPRSSEDIPYGAGFE